MKTPLLLLRAIGKAALYYFLGPSAMLGDIAVDTAVEWANNAWSDLERQSNVATQQAEFQKMIQADMAAVIQMSHQENLNAMRQIAQECCLNASDQSRERFALYLSQIRAHSARR